MPLLLLFSKPFLKSCKGSGNMGTFNQEFGNFGDKNLMKGDFQVRNFRKFGYTFSGMLFSRHTGNVGKIKTGICG